MGRYKELTGMALNKKKQLFIEDFVYSPTPEDIVIFDSIKLIENENTGEKYECKGILRNVPVTRYTENTNGRIYSLALWQKVYNDRAFERSFCLADHSPDNGSVKDIVGVWHNFITDTTTSNADLYCIGTWGGLLLDAAKAGGMVGFSTVGFGELLDDKKTVNPDSYEYVTCDWVLQPSQKVYGSLQHLQNIENENLTENNTNNNVVFKEENKIEVKNMDKLQEANLKMQVKTAIREAKNNPDCVLAVNELQEVLRAIPEGSVDLSNLLTEAITHIQSKAVSQKDQSTSQIDTLLKEKEDLSKKLDRLNKFTKKYIKESKEALTTLKDERVYMLNDIKKLKEQLDVYNEDIGGYKHLEEKQKDDITKLKKQVDEMKETENLRKELARREEHIKQLEKVLKEEGYEMEDEDEYEDGDIIENEETKNDDDTKEVVENTDEKDKDTTENEDEDDEYEYEIIETEDEEDKDIVDELTESKKTKKVKKIRKVKKVKESNKPKIDSAIVKYYEELSAKKPILKNENAKKSILSAKTLLEAVEIGTSLLTKNNEQPLKFTESGTTQYEKYEFKRQPITG